MSPMKFHQGIQVKALQTEGFQDSFFDNLGTAIAKKGEVIMVYLFVMVFLLPRC